MFCPHVGEASNRVSFPRRKGRSCGQLKVEANLGKTIWLLANFGETNHMLSQAGTHPTRTCLLHCASFVNYSWLGDLLLMVLYFEVGERDSTGR